MDAPLCKTCKTRHWSTCLSAGVSSPKSVARHAAITHSNPPFETMAPETQQALNAIAEAAAKQMAADPGNEAKGKRQQAKIAEVREAVAKRGRPATGFDKKAYDREQARIRRAAKKGQPK